MNRTSMILKVLAVFIAVIFMTPLVPAFYIGNVHQGPNIAIEPSPDLMTRATPVKVGDTTVNTATSMNQQRHVVRGNNNDIFTVFESNGQIWFSRSTNNGQSFSTPKNISNDTGFSGTHTNGVPAIAYNGTAIFVVYAWLDSNNGNQERIAFRKSNDNGATWIPALNVQPTYLPNAGGGGTSRRTYPAIAVNNTTVYVVATNYNSGNVLFYMSLNSGTSWYPAAWGGQGELMLTNNGGDPTISVSNNNVYIVWAWTNFGDNDIYYQFSKLGSAIASVNDFSVAQNLYDNNQGSRYPTVVASGTNVYVAWQEAVNGGDEIYFRNTTNNGTSWTPAIGVQPLDVSNSAGNARYPSLTLGSGTLFCTWRDSAVHAQYDVYFSEWYNNAWDTPIFITDNTNTANWPSAAEKIANNRLDVVWTNGTNPLDVLYNGEYVGGSAPVMNWTGEVNYVNDGVNPDSGTTGHTYTFRVSYTDGDNDAPKAGLPKLFIDRNINGNYTGLNEQITMTAVDNTDTTYTDGKLYTYSTRLNLVGTYKYFFSATDSTGRIARGDPTHDTNGPVITSINEPPQLDWVQDWGYINDGIDPNIGFSDTNFTFKIVYTDILNESPAMTFPKLYIDMDGNGNFTDPADKTVSMVQVSALDQTFSDGKVYYYNTTFSMGTYKYKFYVEDMTQLSAETPVKDGPIVSGKGIPPVLSPAGGLGFVADGVDPDFGTDTTLFTFEVKYSDADGDMPALGYPTINLDINRDGNYSANEKFVMDELNATDMDTSDGKVYAYTHTFPVLGLYKYEYYAVDTNGSTSNVLKYPGPNVNSTNKAPKLGWLGSGGFSSDGLDPELGYANGTMFHFQVLYSDVDGDAPAAANPKVWIDLNLDHLETSNEWFTMTDATPSITDFHSEKKYEFNTTLALPGTYSYRFAAIDVKGAPAPTTNAPTKLQTGPIVSVPPDLPPILALLNNTVYNGTGVSPATGDLETQFVYKVLYMDAENDLPDAGFPRVYIDADGDGSYSGQYDIPGTMTAEDALDTNVVDGKVYMFTTTLPIEGNTYAYKFKAEDLDHVAATGFGSINDLVFKGPTVKVNREPLLQFVGTAGFANDGVDPDSALEGSTFTFRVIYKDPEGDKPLDGKVYLRIDLDHNKIIDPTDPKIAMTEAIPADQNYADGKEYTATYTFAEDGTYGYRFEAQDAFDNIAAGPAGLDYIPGPIATEPVPNRLPTLSFTGELYFQADGVNPLTDLKGASFTFRVRYVDLDNDAVSTGFPKVQIGTQSYEMKQADSTDTNFADGKIYTVDIILSKASIYTYTFSVQNSQNQTASLGPVDGPVVTEKAKIKAGQMVPDLMWILILIIVAIIVAIIGYLIGARRKKQPQPQYRQAQRTRAQPPRGRDEGGLRHVDMVPLSSAEVKDEEPVLEKAPEVEPASKKEEVPEKEDEPSATKTWDPSGGKIAADAAAAAAVTGGAKADLKADADQPATTGEDATKPEEKPGPPAVAAETKPDLKDHKADSEAPASDKDAKEPEEKKDKPAEENKENVDEEIDSILAKLEK